MAAIEALRCEQCSSTALKQIGPHQHICTHCGTTLNERLDSGRDRSRATTVPGKYPAQHPHTFPPKSRLSAQVLGVLGILSIALGVGIATRWRAASELEGLSHTSLVTEGENVTGAGENSLASRAGTGLNLGTGGGADAQSRTPHAPVKPATFGAEAIEEAPTVKAELSALTPLKDRLGNVYFVGIITNTGEATLTQPRVDLRLMKASGEVAATAFGYAQRTWLNPGEKAPIQVLAQAAPAYDTLKVTFEPQAERYPRSTIGFAFQSVKLSPDRLLGYRLKGNITNQSQTVASFVQVSVLLKDAHDGIVGLGSGYLGSKTLQPGETLPFEVRVSLVVGTPTQFDLYTNYLPQ